MKPKQKQTYLLQGKRYEFKEKYTFGEWNKILKSLKDADSLEKTLDVILNEEKLHSLLVIFFGTEDVPTTFYEDDFQVISDVLSAFFLRKNNIITSMTQK